MPFYQVANLTSRTLALRTATGIKRLAPGASGPAEGFDLAPSHASYYELAGAKVTAIDADAGKQDAGKPDLASFDAAQVGALATAEKIDLGDIDLTTPDGLAMAKATITAFRAVWDSGNADEVKAAAVAKGIDLGEAKAKYEIVNLIVAHDGVTV